MLEPPLSIRTTSVGHQHLRYGSNGLLPGTPKRKRESSCSRPGPADASRGAKPMEPPNENSARTQKRHTHQTSTAGTSHQRREGGIGRGPPDPWIVSWSEGPHSGCPGGTPRSPLPALVGVLCRQECRKSAPRQRKPAAQECQCRPLGREMTGRVVLVSYYKEAHQKIEDGIIGVLENWKEPLIDSADAGEQKQDG